MFLKLFLSLLTTGCLLFLKAIGIGLSCVTDEYEALMAEPVLQLLSRMVADRSPSTRKELVLMSKNLLLQRLRTFGRRAIEDALSITAESYRNKSKKYGNINNGGEINHDAAVDNSSLWSLSRGGGVSTRTGELNENSVSADLQLITLLLLLQGDDSEEVVAAAQEVSAFYG